MSTDKTPTAPPLSAEERFCVAAVWACHAMGMPPNFCQPPHLKALKDTADQLVERNVFYRITGELRPGQPVEDAPYAFAATGDWEDQWAERIFEDDGHNFQEMADLLAGPPKRGYEGRPDDSALRFCVTRRELEQALQALDQAASGGFTGSLAILSLAAVGKRLDHCLAVAGGDVILRGPGGVPDCGHCDEPGEVILYKGRCEYRWDNYEDQEDEPC
jgi:hypothetical protein